MLGSRKAQSIVEYLLVFAAVVGAVVLATNTVLKTKMGNMLTHVADEAESAVNKVNLDQ